MASPGRRRPRSPNGSLATRWSEGAPVGRLATPPSSDHESGSREFVGNGKPVYCFVLHRLRISVRARACWARDVGPGRDPNYIAQMTFQQVSSQRCTKYKYLQRLLMAMRLFHFFVSWISDRYSRGLLHKETLVHM